MQGPLLHRKACLTQMCCVRTTRFPPAPAALTFIPCAGWGCPAPTPTPAMSQCACAEGGRAQPSRTLSQTSKPKKGGLHLLTAARTPLLVLSAFQSPSGNKGARKGDRRRQMTSAGSPAQHSERPRRPHSPTRHLCHLHPIKQPC